jgi:hypothetical protein
MADEVRYTEPIKCRHCGNKAPMKVSAVASQVRYYEDPQSGMPWEEGPVHEVLICPACEGISVQRYHWHDAYDPERIQAEIVYPKDAEAAPLGLPPAILQEYQAAARVKPVSPNAFGVLLGRLLELVCNERGATEGKLGFRLKELAARGEIPARLVEVGEKLQQLRHVGAHAFLGELGPSEVPIADSLCRAILEYVYTAPRLVSDAEERLKQLRARQAKKKKAAPARKTGGKKPATK